jgi:PAS domain S-box-containing protein
MGALDYISNSYDDYHRLFNETPAPMYIFDSKDYRFLAANDAALVKYDYTRKQFLKLKATDIRPETELKHFYETSSSVPNTYTDAGRFIHLKRTGEQFYVNIFSRGILFEGKEAKLVLSIDIDKKVKTEIALKHALDDISDILESITDGFYTVNRNWELTYINSEFERTLHRSRNEVMGKNLWDVFPEARNLAYYSQYHSVMDNRVSVHFEEYFEPLQIWTQVNAYPTRDGIAIYFIDVTEQRKTRESLFNERQNLLAIINNTNDIIWSIDRKMNIISANEAFWGRLEIITGKTARSIINDDYAPGLINQWQEYYTRAFTGENFKITWTEEHQGKSIYEEINFHPIYGINREITGVSCYSSDITERYEYQRKIESQNTRLREIAWIQSHKVRAPVATLMGLLHLLDLDKEYYDPANKEVLGMISQMTGKFDDVIREITDLTEDMEGEGDGLRAEV